jgi:hypothetical protein
MMKGLALGCLLAGTAFLMPQAAGAFSIPDGCSAHTLAGLKSPDSEAAARITFRNMYPRAVEVWWINGEGKPELYLKLDKDGSETIETFVGHVWKVVDTAGNKCVFTYSAEAGDETVMIME